MTNTGGEGRWPFDRVGDPGAPPSATGSGVPGPGAPRDTHGPGGPGGFSGPVGFGGPAGDAGRGGPDGANGPAAPGGPGSPPSRRDRNTPPPRRRPPLWLLVLIGVVVLGGVAAAVLLLMNREAPEAPPAETVTLPAPTPTIDPIERAEGTAFAGALPSTVLQFALTEFVEHEPLMAAGALEAYRLTYSDGGADTLVVVAGQWRDAAGATAQYDAVLAGLVEELGEIAEATEAPSEPASDEPAADDEPGDETGDEGDGATATPTAEPLPDPVQGPVEVDGQEVGRYVFVPREDGTGSIWWTNTTVLVQVDGPWRELRDVFAAFPL